MAAALLVIYDGRPQDPGAFYQYYVEHHVPLVWKFPRIRGIELERSVEGDIFMIARLRFDHPDDARAALQSPEREVARRDRDLHFPPFEGRIRHQIVAIEEIPLKN